MTDEQRKRFEKWFTDTVLRRMSEPGQWFERDDVGGYIDPTVHDMWRGYVAGEQARDAEVQALREALTEVTDDLAFEIIDKYGPIRAHPDTVRSFDRDMEPVRRAWKLLAGGETGEAE